jgi:CBS domain-containing protein
VKVENILKAKGSRVETIKPEAPLVLVLHKFAASDIGALVVSADGDRILGVISERDIVRGLHKHGERLMHMQARELMSKGVPICSPEDTIRHVMGEMTRTRNRHLPVVSDGKLCGIVSLGDVVKHRLEEMELETNILRESYIARRFSV